MTTNEDLRQYTDYRDYIGFRFKHMKMTKRAFSYQVAATKIGVTRGFLKLLVDKERHISLNKVMPMATYLELNEAELKLFVLLVVKRLSKDAQFHLLVDQMIEEHQGKVGDILQS